MEFCKKIRDISETKNLDPLDCFFLDCIPFFCIEYISRNDCHIKSLVYESNRMIISYLDDSSIAKCWYKKWNDDKYFSSHTKP